MFKFCKCEETKRSTILLCTPSDQYTFFFAARFVHGGNSHQKHLKKILIPGCMTLEVEGSKYTESTGCILEQDI